MPSKDFIKYEMLPEHMRKAARGYVEDGAPVGGFLTAAIENDLVEAFYRADDINLAAMRAWVDWLYNECPALARGSRKAMKAWMEIGGLNGQERSASEDIQAGGK